MRFLPASASIAAMTQVRFLQVISFCSLLKWLKYTLIKPMQGELIPLFKCFLHEGTSIFDCWHGGYIWMWLLWRFRVGEPKAGGNAGLYETITRPSRFWWMSWFHVIYVKASSRFVRTLTISQLCSTPAGNMLNALSGKRNNSTKTDWKLTINNITHYRWMKGYYPTGFYHLLASLTLSHHGLPTVGAPKWPSTSCQLMIY